MHAEYQNREACRTLKTCVPVGASFVMTSLGFPSPPPNTSNGAFFCSPTLCQGQHKELLSGYYGMMGEGLIHRPTAPRSSACKLLVVHCALLCGQGGRNREAVSTQANAWPKSLTSKLTTAHETTLPTSSVKHLTSFALHRRPRWTDFSPAIHLEPDTKIRT